MGAPKNYSTRSLTADDQPEIDAVLAANPGWKLKHARENVARKKYLRRCGLVAPYARRCDNSGEMPDGRHVMEIEDADLNIAELRVKQAAILEHGGEDAEADAADIQAEIDRRQTPVPAVPPPFHPRYVNLCAVTETASTVSTQCWCTSEAEIEEAMRVLTKWCTPGDEKWHGRIVLASAFDHYTKVQRNFIRDGAVLRGIKS